MVCFDETKGRPVLEQSNGKFEVFLRIQSFHMGIVLYVRLVG